MSNIIQITDFAAPELDIYARLTEAQLLNRFDPKNAMFITESPKVICRALDGGCIPVSILVEENRMTGESLEAIQRCGDVPIYTAPLAVLTQLVGYPLTRGLLCAMRRPQLPKAEELLASARRVAILDNIQNPTNVGAIFRSAAALQMDAVLLTPTCCDPLYRRAARVSMGTVFQVPWTRIGTVHTDWPDKGMAQLRHLGFKTAAMALSDDSVSIEDPALAAEEKLAVILGTEGDGLANATIAGCDYTVKIPMAHGVDSLNVAAASAVAFWELRARS